MPKLQIGGVDIAEISEHDAATALSAVSKYGLGENVMGGGVQTEVRTEMRKPRYEAAGWRIDLVFWTDKHPSQR